MSSHSIDADMSDGDSGASHGSALEFTIYTFPTAAPPPSHWQQQQRLRKNKKNNDQTTFPTVASSLPPSLVSGSPSSSPSSTAVAGVIVAVSDPSPLAPSIPSTAASAADNATTAAATAASDNELQMNLSSSRTDSNAPSRMSEQSYVCDSCGRSYHRRESFERHRATHATDTGEETTSKGGFNKQQSGQTQRHSRQTRSDASSHKAAITRLDESSSASPPLFRCAHCGNGNAAFESLGELWRHQASSHPDAARTSHSSIPYSFRSNLPQQSRSLNFAQRSSRSNTKTHRLQVNEDHGEDNERASTHGETSATPLSTIHNRSTSLFASTSDSAAASPSPSKIHMNQDISKEGQRPSRHLRGGANAASPHAPPKSTSVDATIAISTSTPLTCTQRQRVQQQEQLQQQQQDRVDQHEASSSSSSSSDDSSDEGTNRRRRSRDVKRVVRTRERSHSRISPSNIRDSSPSMSLVCDRCSQSFARPAALQRHVAACNAAAEAAAAAVAASKKVSQSNDNSDEEDSGIDGSSEDEDEVDDNANDHGELKRPRTSNAPLVPWNGTNCDGSARPGQFANCPFCGLGLNSRTRFYVHKRTCPDRPTATLTTQPNNNNSVRNRGAESKSHATPSNAVSSRPSSNSVRPPHTPAGSSSKHPPQRRSQHSDSQDEDEDPTDPHSGSEEESGNAGNYRHTCSICQERFTAMSSLFRHADVHPQVGYRGSVFICKFCHSPFKFQQRATKHVPHCRRLPPNLTLSLPEEIIQHVAVVEATGKEDFYSQLRLDQDKKKRKVRSSSSSSGIQQRRGRPAIVDDDSEEEEEHGKGASRHDRKRTKLHHASPVAAASSSGSSRFKSHSRSLSRSGDVKQRGLNAPIVAAAPTTTSASSVAPNSLHARSCRTCKREWLNGISDYNYNLHVASCDRSARQLQALMGDAAKAEKQKQALTASKHGIGNNSNRSGKHDSTYSLDASDLLNTNTSRLNRSTIPNDADGEVDDDDESKRGRRRSSRPGRAAKFAADSGDEEEEEADDEGEYDDSAHASEGDASAQGPKVYFTCPVCQLNFDRESSLAAHVKAYSSDEGNRFPCPVCPHRFPSRVMMHRHRQRHYSDISNIRLAPGETLMKAEDKGKGSGSKSKQQSPFKPKVPPQPKSHSHPHSHAQPPTTQPRSQSPSNPPNKRRRAAAKRYAEETYEDDEDYDPPSEDEMEDDYNYNARENGDEQLNDEPHDGDHADRGSAMHAEADAENASESESARARSLALMSSLTSAVAAAAATSDNSKSTPSASSAAAATNAAPVGRVQLFIPSNASNPRIDSHSKHKHQHQHQHQHQQPQQPQHRGNTHSSASSAIETDDKRRGMSDARTAHSHRTNQSERNKQPKPTVASVHPLSTDALPMATPAPAPSAMDMHHFMQLQASMPTMGGYLQIPTAQPVNEAVMLAPYSAYAPFPGMAPNPAAAQPPPGFVYPPPGMSIHPMHFQHPAAPAFFAPPPQPLQPIALPNMPPPSGFSQSPPAMSPLTAMYAAAAATNPAAAAAAAAAATFGYDFVSQNNMPFMMQNMQPFPFPKP